MSVYVSAKLKHVPLYYAGCGVRKRRAAYLVTNIERAIEEYGLSHLVYDPPILVEDLSAWGLCAQGIGYMTQLDGTVHAMTLVGSDSYPNTADILEEWMAGYASTLVPLKNNNVCKLTKESRLLIFHASGWIENYLPYRQEYLKTRRPRCFLDENDPEREKHLAGETMCAGLHWQHVIGGAKNIQGVDRYVERTIGQTTYEAVGPIKNNKPINRIALVAWRPIDEIHLVDDPDNQADIDAALKFLYENTAIPVQLPTFLTDN